MFQNRFYLISISTTCLFCFIISSFAQVAIDLEDFRDLPRVGSPQISPDENFLLYSLGKVNIDENKFDNELKILDFRNNKTHTLGRDISDAKWSPDGGVISFRGTYDGVYGIYSSAPIVKNGKLGLNPKLLAAVNNSNHFLGHPTKKNYAWSPDGRYIAYVSADEATCRRIADANAPIEVERTLYKSRRGISDNCKSRIFLATSDGSSQRALTESSYDSHSLTWTDDGKEVIFLSNHTSSPDDNYNNEIWSVNIQTNQTKRLTQTAGTEHDPNANPDNEWIAFPATIRERNTKDSPPENTAIYFMKKDGSDRMNGTADLDRRASNPQWHPDGKWLYFKARNHGSNLIYRVRRGKEPKMVSKMVGSIGSYTIGKDRLYFTLNLPGQPSEIFSSKLDGSDIIQLTHETQSWIEDKNIAEIEDFWFDSFDGTRVQGFLSYPKNISEGNKIPVVHRIHGGPHGMYGFSFSDFNEMLVSKGMAVLFINPRGSTGYGQSFADGTIKEWGGGDYQDLMTGVDYALSRYDFLDSTNMVVTGGSYGGFMTNWVVTQTDRYKAAVTVASVSNLISFYGTSLYQLLIETEFEGMPWDDYDLLWQYSPMKHISNVKTPTLLLHGEQDMDVPITQAEEFYIALRKLGIPTRFVRYPNEGHGVRQPIHREHYYKEIFNWFDKYLSQEEVRP